MLALLRRLHFYVGLFVGPFILVAALTGTLYVITPQLENHLYAEQLFTSSQGEAQPLSRQIAAAQAWYQGDDALYAVRPAPQAGETTRVMFRGAQSAASESLAVFVDPVTLNVQGALTVYGTSGILPFRTTLDYLHRSLLLGEAGRNYSELAASWLWVAALGGLILWLTQRTPRVRAQTGALSRGQRVLRQRRWHTWLGASLLIGLLFLSVTGLTWSNWAGNNIGALRAQMGWLTPQVDTRLQATQPAIANDPHAEHHGMMHHDMSSMVTVTAEQFDGVWAAARAAGITASKVEIRPSTQPDKAWTVTEVDRSWPTQVDAAAVDANSLRVIDKVEFAQFGLLAKLTRWGVDAHMGILFGLPNQLLLVALGLGLSTMIALGYRMWWLRRPAQPGAINPLETLTGCWQQLTLPAKAVSLLVAIALGYALPVMGVSLVMFIAFDVLRWRQAQQRLQMA
ncbi:hypothetical protein CIG19_05935 [Enterobacterales bacterium CwR94]|nr:hypothetical protein CIG19_05935 [Enterobacterales bacterium CwR94]